MPLNLNALAIALVSANSTSESASLASLWAEAVPVPMNFPFWISTAAQTTAELNYPRLYRG